MSKKPFILSIIVPTRHRNDQLSVCLEAIGKKIVGLSAQTVQVIITDDGTETTAQTVIENLFPWAQWIKGHGLGPAANRNNGASAAEAEWLVFTDDDCVPGSNWINSILSTIKAIGATEVDVIEGKTEAPSRRDNPFEYYVENLNGGNYWSCNLAVRRTTFLKLGGFDEDFLEAGGEDMEFAWRLKTHSIKTLFVPEAVVFHPVRKLNWRLILWRTFLIRWKLLYDLKTGQSVKLGSSKFTIVLVRIKLSIIDLARSSWHLISRFDIRFCKTQLFNQVWQYLTFPIVLPYLVIWDLRFHKQLKNKLVKQESVQELVQELENQSSKHRSALNVRT
jgi:GT2 family glycosyltransferase